jgi:sortase (surface protein transpeptidase)
MSQYPHQKSISFLDLVWKFKFHLVLYIFCISTVTFAVLYALGGVPDELRVLNSTETTTPPTITREPSPKAIPQNTTQSVPSPKPKTAYADNEKGELPRRIIIEKVGLNAIINDPTKNDNATLNAYLTRGVVRYPGSGTLGYGNMFLLGHSSSLKIINNQAYKIFNGLKLLNLNDRIRLQSTSKEYVYSVTSIALVKSDEAFIDLSSTKNMITLATCNVLGEKQERFLIQAVFISSRDL